VNERASVELADFYLTYKPPTTYHPQRHENATFEQLRDLTFHVPCFVRNQQLATFKLLWVI
jgi:hypothetical protein